MKMIVEKKTNNPEDSLFIYNDSLDLELRL